MLPDLREKVSSTADIYDCKQKEKIQIAEKEEPKKVEPEKKSLDNDPPIIDIKDIFIEGDAKIVINQIKDECNVNSDIIKPLHKEVKKLIKKFDYINFEHIYRKYNSFADSLANQAIIEYFELKFNI